MLHETSLEHYFEEVQKLARLIAANEREPEDLLALVQRELQEAHDDDAKRSFFLGEQAFYQRRYKIALKHYMKAKSVPLFHFSCYRACAYLFDEESNSPKALEFVKKALALFPEDWMASALCSSLLANSGPVNEVESPASVSLGAEEFDELSRLFQEEQHTEEKDEEYEMSQHTPAAQIQRPVELTTDVSQALERRIANFQEEQKRRLREYIGQHRLRVPHQDYLFHVLDGWQESRPAASPYTTATLLEQRAHRTSGGYFLKWHGKGIAINPGTHFLQTLHRQGFRIDDIDCVIVTKSTQDSYADVKEIYDLNTLVNTAQEKLHVIHYYLSHAAYQAIGRSLKPHFKQERHSVHCLELYLDSPDVETITLDDGIILHYFPTSAQSLAGAKTEELAPPSIGIRLDLTGPAQAAGPRSHTVKVGYVSGASWSPLLAEHLQGCDLLVVGVEETSHDDYAKIRYNNHSLGYFGSLSLLEEIRPRLMLCCEFAGNEGDVRLEVAKKLRADFSTHHNRPTTILPGNLGLKVDLTTLQILCAASQSFVDPAQVHVARTSDAFGALHYLSPQCML